MKYLSSIVFLAVLWRIIICVLSWNDIVFIAPEKSISIVYQRSAYLIAMGYGYAQTLPGSPSYEALSAKIDSINSGKEVVLELSSKDGLYFTQHYPPGWSIIGSILYKFTGLPIRWSMQFFGILVDAIGLVFFYLLSAKLLNRKFANTVSVIYALYPPIAVASVALTPDSYILTIAIITSYLFCRFIEMRDNASIILIGIITGIGAYFRSDMILLPVFLSLLLFGYKQPMAKTIKNWVTLNLVIAGLAFIVIMPWGIYNLNTHHRFTLSSTALGGTLVTGLAAFPNPWNLGPSDIDRQKEARENGIHTPFEANGDQFFKNKFKSYITEQPLYYLKSMLKRSVYFVAAPYTWGLKKPDKVVAFSKLRSDGELLNSVKYILSTFWSEAISAIVSFLSLVCLLIFSRSGNLLIKLCGLNILHVYLTHIPIHTAPNYTLPIIFCNILIVTYSIFVFLRINPESK